MSWARKAGAGIRVVMHAQFNLVNFVKGLWNHNSISLCTFRSHLSSVLTKGLSLIICSVSFYLSREAFGVPLAGVELYAFSIFVIYFLLCGQGAAQSTWKKKQHFWVLQKLYFYANFIPRSLLGHVPSSNTSKDSSIVVSISGFDGYRRYAGDLELHKENRDFVPNTLNRL